MENYIDSFPGREIKMGNSNFLYFGGTAYLGLQTDTKFQQLFIDNIKRYGTNYGASRKSNVRIAVYDKVEKYLANFVESESCITVSSGYLAGQLVSQSFNNPDYSLFYAPNTHSALCQSKTVPYTTYTSLNNALKKHLRKKHTTPVVLLDSIDFSGTNYPNFDGLKNLPLDKIILVADDSHGIGIVGENGQGVYKTLATLNTKELIVCCSLGKGYGVQGGAVFGTKKRIGSLSGTAFFGGASPATPSGMATLLAGDSIYKEKRNVLLGNIDYFLKSFDFPEKFSFMHGHPSFSYLDTGLTKHLEKNNILVTDFSYPNEDASLMSRIVLSASHLKEDVEHLFNCINDYFTLK
ncbi:7-keto-8-aminopelargonate synthetase-like enzyme [Saonia flava]|uniref:7-keto-8-aminopelargonate synthetase-like enzyme n=1 Tax=Saonia flava TaxID=523696 RepID=A0A846R440_9FLAO|nr:aminotransferase class I/II-fold pyridoxal phosphate-dependent enzyme [Saonia flava]NJB72124.1 7-keto-8-aminopelargonate synthetase-like enzyme [Saonia flava]